MPGKTATPGTTKKTRRTRRSPAETRSLMLEAGVELVRRHAADSSDQALAGPLAHIRLTEVARLATEIAADRQPGVGPAQPITTGAIYPLWPTQADYQTELMFHLLGPDAYPEDRDAVAELLALADTTAPVESILTTVAAGYLERARANPLTYVYLTFYVLGEHPKVREAAQGGYRQLGIGYAAALERLLAREGRRPAPGRTVADFVVALLAVLEGFCLRARVDPGPGTPPPDDPAPHAPLPELLGATLTALWNSFTEPAG
ncbi:hypothetical protein [Streptomyces purpurogeneiscleroticus]|uniref:hypothetical protein n=1 Tax=Streptomyces purpurogeneiscleroticus TaxID=68259 RepID=UPI001CBEDF3E|nr:hypothetical protein [Streptomyces purpurogeneiscleroticus]MBZ4019934.1 hypothetical protein [Streptomyces purpurogeneiscleroticus]